MSALAVRAEPLGEDRHRRRYWWGLGGQRGCLFVEDAEGGLVGAWTSPSEVAALMAALDKRGVREARLLAELTKVLPTPGTALAVSQVRGGAPSCTMLGSVHQAVAGTYRVSGGQSTTSAVVLFCSCHRSGKPCRTTVGLAGIASEVLQARRIAAGAAGTRGHQPGHERGHT